MGFYIAVALMQSQALSTSAGISVGWGLVFLSIVTPLCSVASLLIGPPPDSITTTTDGNNQQQQQQQRHQQQGGGDHHGGEFDHAPEDGGGKMVPSVQGSTGNLDQYYVMQSSYVPAVPASNGLSMPTTPGSYLGNTAGWGPRSAEPTLETTRSPQRMEHYHAATPSEGGTVMNALREAAMHVNYPTIQAQDAPGEEGTPLRNTGEGYQPQMTTGASLSSSGHWPVSTDRVGMAVQRPQPPLPVGTQEGVSLEVSWL